jgi:hypothetical protein
MAVTATAETTPISLKWVGARLTAVTPPSRWAK